MVRKRTNENKTRRLYAQHIGAFVMLINTEQFDFTLQDENQTKTVVATRQP
jgi:hypothetical protein